MSEFEPNPEQARLIDSTEGLYLVDAGAGTGKTFTITRRYANILDREGVEPEDVLLLTFTDNAAAEMKERAVASCDYSMAALRDAPISTFHSLCHRILTRYGFDAPRELGIDDRITSSTRIVDSDVIEAAYFREFLGEFIDAHPEHEAFFQTLSRPESLLGLIRALLAKGIFPTREGWYRHGESYLDGDFEAFRERFEAANEPGEGARGPTQSDLRARLSSWDDGCYLRDAPTEQELRGGRGTKQVPQTFARQAFEEEREELKAFVHDVYFEYVEFALSRNYLTYGFLLMFAFALLCEDPDVREELRHEYVMIDEFQDTNEVQFKLALLLSRTDNLCVVGDWKQSIYGFQYAAVENITDFQTRIRRFRDELNDATKRVPYPVEDVTTIELEQNYRSTQPILDFSERSLTLEAVDRESIDVEAVKANITSLHSNASVDNTRIEAFVPTREIAERESLTTGDDGPADDVVEYEVLLTKIQEIVGNEAYAVLEDGELRPPRYDDVAVLTRTRDFGREFQSVAAAYGIPVAYEGGIELFETDPAKLLLAWLRIVEGTRADRGWAVVLERAGYSLTEIEHVLDTHEYPAAMVAFREELAAAETVASLARQVFARYGFEDAYADALLATLSSTFEGTGWNRAELVRFVEENLQAGSTVEVDASPGSDSVTVQTIHAAKGLEHPIVIVANLNRHRFPPSGGGADRIRYEEPLGLRQTKLVADEHGTLHTYDNWRYRLCSAALPTSYDEERRLLYVAMTRAQQHLLFAAGENPSPFFEGLGLDSRPVAPAVRVADVDPVEPEPFPTDLASADRPLPFDGEYGRGDGRQRRSTDSRHRQRTDSRQRPRADSPQRQYADSRQQLVPRARRRLNPHDLMDESVYEETDEGKGTEFGTAVHDFAEAYVEGKPVEPSGEEREDERRVRDLLDSLDGELRAEVPAHLPLDVDGEAVTISGIIDLLCLTPERVEVIDYKTDRDRVAESEYRTQLSVYAHVVRQCYPDREVSAAIFYTAEGEIRRIDPRSMDGLAALVRETLAAETRA